VPDGSPEFGADTLADGLPALVARRAEEAASLLAAHPGASALPPPRLPPHPPSLTWRNWLFTAPGLRRAHVELFAVDAQFSVLHVCLMPDLTRREPVFGLDLIGGKTVATGVFLDLSPTLPCASAAAAARRLLAAPGPLAFGHPRPRPDWGDIFSPDFICVRARSPADAAGALDHGFAVLAAYLAAFAAAPATAAPGADPPGQLEASVRAAQSAYCRAQRANRHTRRMLAGFVGADEADRFIDTVLFPLPG
jgi:hypothetical protein